MDKKKLHIAAGIICDQHDNVFITQRPLKSHMGVLGISRWKIRR